MVKRNIYIGFFFPNSKSSLLSLPNKEDVKHSQKDKVFLKIVHSAQWILYHNCIIPLDGFQIFQHAVCAWKGLFLYSWLVIFYLAS